MLFKSRCATASCHRGPRRRDPSSMRPDRRAVARMSARDGLTRWCVVAASPFASLRSRSPQRDFDAVVRLIEAYAARESALRGTWAFEVGGGGSSVFPFWQRMCASRVRTSFCSSPSPQNNNTSGDCRASCRRALFSLVVRVGGPPLDRDPRDVRRRRRRGGARRALLRREPRARRPDAHALQGTTTPFVCDRASARRRRHTGALENVGRGARRRQMGARRRGGGGVCSSSATRCELRRREAAGVRRAPVRAGRADLRTILRRSTRRAERSTRVPLLRTQRARERARQGAPLVPSRCDDSTRRTRRRSSD